MQRGRCYERFISCQRLWMHLQGNRIFNFLSNNYSINKKFDDLTCLKRKIRKKKQEYLLIDIELLNYCADLGSGNWSAM